MNHQPNTPASLNEAVANPFAYPPYCLHCEKEGHRTKECWSTHCVTPRSNEIDTLVAPGAAIAAREQGMVSVDLYLKLADAMGYDSGKDGMEFSPEEWAATLLKDALAHRATPSEALSPATVAQPVTDEQIDALLDADADVLDIVSDKRARLRRFARKAIALARPCASQGCGGAVRQALKQIIEADDAQALTQQLIDIGRAALDKK